jgi:hypothetical protein
VSTPVLVYVLTALAAVVIVLTWLRLGRGTGGAGRAQVGRTLVRVHTVAGVLALLVWVIFLVADEETPLGSSTAGIVALALWWVVALTGLMILVRWMPSRGRHASSATVDRWSRGPWLSVLAHGGMLVGVCVFTYAYLNSTV